MIVTPMSFWRLCSVIIGLAVVLAHPGAWAQTSPPEGASVELPPAPIRTNIELSGGPVTGASRVVGLGGAYTSVGEGFAGFIVNPATLGNRKASAKKWWALDGTLTFSFLPLAEVDPENDGHTNEGLDRPLSWVLGSMVQLDFVGLGWQWRSHGYKVEAPKDPDRTLTYKFDEHLVGLGFQLEDLGLALGIKGIFESTEMEMCKKNCLPFLGENIAGAVLEGDWGDRGFVGVELGGLYRPSGQPYRVGAALKLVGPQKLAELSGLAQNPSASEAAKARIPGEVRSTSHLRLGASYQFGRPYNPKRSFDRIHETDWFRYYLLDEDIPAEGGPEPGVEVTQPKVQMEVARASDGEPVSEIVVPEGAPEAGAEEPPPSGAEGDDGVEEATRYALVSLDLVLSPPQFGSRLPFLGPEGFVVQRFTERAGRRWTLAVHAGTEVEPIPGWLKVRLGTYFEPSRFSDQTGRMHLTGGVDVHFPHLWALEALGAPASPQWGRVVDVLREVPFTARIYADAARDYLSVGVSIGVWN